MNTQPRSRSRRVAPSRPAPRSPHAPAPRRSRSSRPRRAPASTQQFVKPMVAGGLMFAFVGLLADGRSLRWRPAAQDTVSYDACQTIVATDARLSRSQLAQLLTVPERNNQSQVREIVSEPYCTMPEVEIRAGVMARREAYPLEFQPETKLVLLYEGEEYAGYRFSFETE